MSDDPRVQPLIDAVRQAASNYDPHFANVTEREIAEATIFLARIDALREVESIPILRTSERSVPRELEPIPMILFCHNCGVQHICEKLDETMQRLPSDTSENRILERQSNRQSSTTMQEMHANRTERSKQSKPGEIQTGQLSPENQTPRSDAIQHGELGVPRISGNVRPELYDLRAAGNPERPEDAQLGSLSQNKENSGSPVQSMQHDDRLRERQSGPFRTCRELSESGAWISHSCAYCGHVWRPADVPTTGVKEIATRGSRDSSDVVRGVINKTARFRPQWRHKARGTTYVELGRGEFQCSSNARQFREAVVAEGDILVAYKGEDNRVWIRQEDEFDDGRFEKL